MQTKPFTIDNQVQNQVLLVLSDYTVIISSVHGQRLLTYQLPVVDMVDDIVIDMISPNVPDEPSFVLLTKRGKLIVLNYTIIDSVIDYQ